MARENAPADPVAELGPTPEESAPEDTEVAELGPTPEESAPEDTEVAELRVMTMVGVTVELPSSYPEVVLREVASPWRELRFRIGYPEGVALAHAWRRLDSPRPLTHEVWADVMRQLSVTLEVVRIVGVDNGVYFAEMVLSGGSRTFTVSCRPSDALNLALRQPFSVPILVAEPVLVAT